MTKTVLRGRILSFEREPQSPEDVEAFSYIEDGALVIADGLIEAVGTFDEINTSECNVVDHRPNLLMAGFVDTHLHFPQVQVIASWGAQLLDWLNNYTFPEETRFVDKAHADGIAKVFFDQLIAHGTTSAVAYCSVHTESAEAYFEEAARRDMRMIGGKVMMDRNAPDGLRDTPQSGYDDSKAMLEKWHGRGRALYAITPRFAITSTQEQLEMAGALAGEFPECHIQTHLSENHDEIALTKELFPEARDYIDVYQQVGLLTDKSLLGHSIHLEPREIDAMVDTGAHPVFCPTSNLFLGSGLFDYEGLRARGLVSGVATDIGGGTSYSMLTTLAEGYKVLALRGQKLHPFRAFDWITRGNAETLGLADKIGTLEPGTEADVVVLDARATEAMAIRMDRVETLAEELFLLQVMGDDRAIAETYVAGKAMKQAV
ncbi:guanine deaminase [Shimia abyssi]|nr:guanine deaminase [Shimia abyssi]